jgi:hypothetical protein
MMLSYMNRMTRQHGLEVPLHVGDLDVGDGAAGREKLELASSASLAKASIGSVTCTW